MKAATNGTISPVRLRPDDQKYIKKLAKERHETQTAVLHHAVELLKREKMFLEARETYLALSKAQLKEIRHENQLFDMSSADGID